MGFSYVKLFTVLQLSALIRQHAGKLHQSPGLQSQCPAGRKADLGVSSRKTPLLLGPAGILLPSRAQGRQTAHQTGFGLICIQVQQDPAQARGPASHGAGTRQTISPLERAKRLVQGALKIQMLFIDQPEGEPGVRAGPRPTPG